MKHSLAFILTIFISAISFAHQAEISTTMLIEKQGKWLLQIKAPLSSFEYELKVHHGDSAYQSPEEFQVMVAQLVQEQLAISFDGKTVLFSDSQVRIGHETSVVMSMNGVPSEYMTLRVVNGVFSDINKSRSALVVLKEGVEVKRYEMNASNDHTVALKLNDEGFEMISVSSAYKDTSYYALLVLTVLLMAGGLVWYRRKSRITRAVPVAIAE